LTAWEFFSILTFLIKIQEINGQNLFLDLTFLNHASPVGATYGGVAQCALARLKR
jgi:hypothetical protein